uniref:Uncharacterized protein n=1 Tax=Solanum tuberosum TaxID=4113 RepID=M1B1W0_SOLTU
MAELKLESELGTMMGLGPKFGGDGKRDASGKIMGCFCAFDVEQSPQGCELCNRPPLHPDDEENLHLGYAIGTLKEHRPYIDQIRIKYFQQIHESYVCFLFPFQFMLLSFILLPIFEIAKMKKMGGVRSLVCCSWVEQWW